MRENFPRALTHVFGSEGGLSMDRNDPGNWTGGKVGNGVLKGTKYGIAANTYPNEDIRNLTRERAAFLYKRDYWDKVRADELPPGVDLIAFDMAVNTGLRRAAITLQRAAGIEADGKIGPRTIAAINAKTPKVFIYSLTVERLKFYQNLTTWARYGRGWKRRVLSVEREAQKWAAERQLAPTRTQVAEAEEAAHESRQATQTAFYSEPAKQESTMPLKGWKMFLFNAVVAVFGVAEAASWSDFVPEPYDGWIIAAIGGINLLLRAYTTTPIFQRTK